MVEGKVLPEEEDNNQIEGDPQHRRKELVAKVHNDNEKETLEVEEPFPEDEKEAKEERIGATDMEKMNIWHMNVQRK